MSKQRDELLTYMKRHGPMTYGQIMQHVGGHKQAERLVHALISEGSATYEADGTYKPAPPRQPRQQVNESYGDMLPDTYYSTGPGRVFS